MQLTERTCGISGPHVVLFGTLNSWVTRHRRNLQVHLGLFLLLACLAGPAAATVSDGVVRIGVLTDLSGPFADAAGQGSVVAAQLAAEDFNGRVGSSPIEIVSADHQNRPDIGATIARRWFDQGGVDAITDLPVSSVALAVQNIARERRRTLLITGAASSDVTGTACSPFSTHWADDSHALATGTARGIVQAGGRSWFFVTADYAFGHAMERDASQTIAEAGGRIVGQVRHPLGTTDFSSFMLQAEGSGAEVIGLASGGSDTANALRSAREFGLTRNRKLASFLIFITDIDALGLETAQDLLVVDGFYWDQDETARRFAERFRKRIGRMPTKGQAAVYASVAHYLKAVASAGTDEALRVNEAMRRLPVDYTGRPGTIRADGRVIYDLTLYAVKKPAESRGRWDYYKPVGSIPGPEAFRPAGRGGCVLDGVPR